MKIQQHDDVVVDAGVIAAGLYRASAGGRGVTGGRGRRQGLGYSSPPSPPLYRPPGGSAGPGIPSMGGAAKGGNLPPKASGGAPSPRVPNPRRRGGPKGGAHLPTRGWFPSHFSPWGPPG